MELRRYLEILDRRKWVILLTALVAVMAVGIGTLSKAPIYSSSAIVRVGETGAGGRIDYNETTYSQRLINTYVQMLTTRPFLEQTISRLKLDTRPESLAGAVKVEQLSNTELIRITVDNRNPADAARIANTLATILTEQESRDTQYILTVEQAVPASSPKGQRAELFLLLGLLAGVLGGTVLAFVLESLDPAIHSAEDLGAMVSVPVLGRIPRSQPLTKAGLVLRAGASESPVGEAFRVLGASTLAVASDSTSWDPQQRKVLLVASPVPGSGNSTVVANLSVALARAGRKVIAVDCDLKHPTLHEFFGLPNKRGLTEALLDPSRPEAALLATRTLGLRLMPSGSLSAGSAELLNSPSMPELLQRLAADADIVLLDSPPMLASADATVLASMVDGVMLVASRDETTMGQMEQMLKQLETVGGKALGVIFNKSKEGGGLYFRHYSSLAGASNGTRSEEAVAPPLKRIV